MRNGAHYLLLTDSHLPPPLGGTLCLHVVFLSSDWSTLVLAVPSPWQQLLPTVAFDLCLVNDKKGEMCWRGLGKADVKRRGRGGVWPSLQVMTMRS